VARFCSILSLSLFVFGYHIITEVGVKTTAAWLGKSGGLALRFIGQAAHNESRQEAKKVA
jgi:hypothetical protein